MYSYDSEGNRVTSHLSATHVIDDDNRLLRDDAYVYVYDSRGNLARRTEQKTGFSSNYTYDIYNRMVRAEVRNTKGIRTLTMGYDAFGRRTWLNGGATGNIAFIYDGTDIALDRRASGQEVVWSRYTHGQQTDQPMSVERFAPGQLGKAQPGTGQVYYYHADHQGSIRNLTNAMGEVVNNYDYDSYGRLLLREEGVEQPYSYTGREWDADLSLFYYRARHYDPLTGRFLQTDPLGFRAGDTNVYAYVFNSPMNWRDPTGMTAAAGYAGTAGIGLAPSAGEAAVGVTLACLFMDIASVFNALNEGEDLEANPLNWATCSAMAKRPKAQKPPSAKPEPYPYLQFNDVKKDCQTMLEWCLGTELATRDVTREDRKSVV